MGEMMSRTLAERSTSSNGDEQGHSPGPCMPFGQYKGASLMELPTEYLCWVSGLGDLRQPLLGRVIGEMARRLAALEVQP